MHLPKDVPMIRKIFNYQGEKMYLFLGIGVNKVEFFESGIRSFIQVYKARLFHGAL